MTTSGTFLFPNGEDQGPIHLQCCDCRATGCGAPDQVNTLPVEVVVPYVESRMEEGYVLTTLWVDGSLPRSLAERARDTGEGKIVGGVRTTRIHRHNVINVEGRFLA